MPGSAGGGALQLLFQINADDKGATSTLKTLEQQFGLLDAATKKLAADLGQLNTSLNQVNSAAAPGTAAANALAGGLKNASASAQGLSGALQGLKASLPAVQQLVASFGQLTGFSGALGTLASSLANITRLGNLLGPVGLAIGGIAALGGGLIETASKVAATGEKLLELSQRTGLSVEALSGLRVAANLTNTNIDSLGVAFSRFRARILSAEAGTHENREALIRLGIDGPAALRNMDGALDQLIRLYDSTSDAARKAQILQDAFGARVAANFTPVIIQAGGSLANLVKQAKDLNQLFTKEQAEEANRYADAVKRLSLAFEGLGKSLSTSVIPALTVFVTILKQGITDPKTFLENIMQDINAGALQTGLWINTLRQAGQELASELPKLATQGGDALVESQKDVNKRLLAENLARIEVQKQIIRANSQAALALFDEDERKNKQQLEDGIQSLQSFTDTRIELNKQRAKVETETANALADLDKSLSSEAFARASTKIELDNQLTEIARRRAATDKTDKAAILALDQQESVVEQRLVELQKSATADEIRALAILLKLKNDVFEIEQKREKANATARDEQKKDQDKLDDQQKKLYDNILALLTAEGELAEKRADFGTDNLKSLEKQNDEMKNLQSPFGDKGFAGAVVEQAAARQREALSPLIEKWRELKDAVTEAGRAITDDFAQKAGIKFEDAAHKQIDLAGSLSEGLSNLADQGMASFTSGIGEMVHSYVTLGTTGPAVMRKILAETLATLAEQAAVQALYWTAYGFAMLATLQFAEAANAFTAAAVFATVAVGSALLGRAIAPKNANTSATANTVQNLVPPNTTIQAGQPLPAGGTPGSAFGGVTDAINNLNNKISSMSPGDVVTTAADTHPSAFATGVTNATQKDGSFRRQLGLTLLPST